MLKRSLFTLVLPVLSLLSGPVLASGLPKPNPVMVERLGGFVPEDFIVYQDEHARHVVTVFTDVNCPICRRLHNQLGDYQMYEIAVRYAAFPNIGNALEQMHGVWCSADRKAAMGQAKRSEPVAVAGCRSAVVDQQFELAMSAGLRGTPAIVTPAGRVIYGHVQAERLLRILEAEAASGDQIQ